MFSKKDLNYESLTIVVIVLSTIFVGAILAMLIKYFHLQDHVHDFLLWIDSAGVYGHLLYIVTVIAVVVFLIPGVFITMGAGFIFGVVVGSIYIVVGTTLGAAISFILARYIFKDRVTKFYESHKKAKFINEYFSADGWKIILCTRLIPFFPFKASNYLFGLTKFKLSSFLSGTFLGIWPITIFNVYVGSLAASLSNLGDTSELGNEQIYFYLGGFLLLVGAIFYLARRAKLSLDNYLLMQKQTQQ